MSSAQQEKIFGLPAQTTMRLVNVFVCTGASVVIFGAMAKILHLSWADWALKIGLTTEAIIFLIYAILPPEGHAPAGGGVSDLPTSVVADVTKRFDELLKDHDIRFEKITMNTAAGSDHNNLIGTSVIKVNIPTLLGKNLEIETKV